MENYDALGTANFFISGEKWKEAKQVLNLVRPYAKTVGQLDAIGKAYSECRDWGMTLEIANELFEVVDIEPQRSNIRHSMIRALLNLNRPNEALKLIEDQIYYNRDPANLPSIDMDKAMALFMLNRKTESEQVLRSIRTNNPDLVNRILYNLAAHEFANGDFKRGMKYFVNCGRELNTWKTSPFPSDRQWRGHKCDVIVVVAEGGIGDEIINVRFMRYLEKFSGSQVLWFTNREDLGAVFRANGFATFHDQKDWDNTWMWAYSFELPHLLSLDEKDLWDGPYLRPRRQISLQTDRTPKVGIKLQGNPDYEQDLHRALPERLLLKAIPEKAWKYKFDLDGSPSSLGPQYVSLSSSIIDWDDTLDLLDQMDIVVTSCTSIAHAASAMGKKTVVLVPIMNYYTWARPGPHSPWYSENTTIIRQTETGNWDKPLEELKEYLDKNL